MNYWQNPMWIKRIPGDKDTWPVKELGGQVDVEFFGTGWSWAIVGIVTLLDDGFEWAAYDQQNDKYILWDAGDPDYYRYRTLPPEIEEKITIHETTDIKGDIRGYR